MGVPNSGLLQDANATTLDPETDRKVNNLDEHIAKGGPHGERAQEIKRGLDVCHSTVCGHGGGHGPDR
jgi:hypothetical protein